MKKANPIIPMKKFKKHINGDLYVGMRAGCNSTHLRIGVLLRGYYTLNYPWRNAAYVLRCEDGRERSYQFIKKIKPEQIKEIQKQREEYLEKR